MHHRDRMISDEMLGAYADGELPRGEGVRVEAALGADRMLRERLEAVRHVSMLVRAAVRAGEALNDELQQPASARSVGSRNAWLQRALRWVGSFEPIAVSFATGLVAALGVMLLLQAPPEAGGQWQQLTLALHQRFVTAMQAGQGYPLDVADANPDRVGALLADSIGYRPSIPDLSADAYVLNGARVITTLEGPVVYALYTSSANPLLGLVVMRAPRAEPSAAVAQASVRLVSWRRDGARFAFVGTHSLPELERLAKRYKDAVDLRMQ